MSDVVADLLNKAISTSSDSEAAACLEMVRKRFHHLFQAT